MDDQQWTAAFTTALRRRQFESDTIRGTLHDVKKRCAESGQSAVEAFGDPVLYAATIPTPASRINWLVGIAFSAFLLTLLGWLTAGLALGRGVDYPITWGMTIFATLAIPLVPLAFGRPNNSNSSPDSWLRGLPFWGLTLLGLLLVTFLPGVIARPKPVVLFTCLACLPMVALAGSAFGTRHTSGETSRSWNLAMNLFAIASALGPVLGVIAYCVGHIL